MLLFSLFVLFIAASCGPGLEGARAAVERAEAMGERLESTNAPTNTTINYRMHMKKAVLALEKKHYREAQREATEAEEAAGKILHSRELLANELRLRLARLRLSLESQPRPVQAVEDGYFDALDAFENREYEKAADIIADIETRVIRETRFSEDDTLIIQANLWYYQQDHYIPVYESISEEGEPGKVILELKEPARAKFLGAKYLSREIIYVHVYILDTKYRINGWVNKRFVQ